MVLFSVIIFLPTFEISVYQHQTVKAEIIVTLDAGLHIGNGRDADGSVLVHNVDEYPALADLTRADAVARGGGRHLPLAAAEENG